MHIETDRLILRSMEKGDSEILYNYRSDPLVCKYQNWLPKSVKEAEEFIDKYSNYPNWIPGNWFQLGVYYKDENILIGDIGLHLIDILKVELGFSIAPEYQRKGFGSESVKAVINYLIAEKGVAELIGTTDPENEASISLLEKLGFIKTEVLKNNIEIRGEWRDDVIFKMRL